MNQFKRISLIVILLLVFGVPVMAQDVPTVEPTEEVIVVEATEAATVEATPDVTVIYIEQPTDETPTDTPVTIVNNNGFSFEQVAISFFAFVLTIFAGIKLFVVPILKSNAELAKMASEYVPQATFDRVIGFTEGLQRWAETLTPSFKGDDEGLKRIREEVAELKALLYPVTPPSETPPVEG